MNNCLKTRKIKSCEECCRYYDCTHKVRTLFVNDSGCLKLGYEILEQICYDFKKAWKSGHIKKIEALSNYLRSAKPSILTAEQVNGLYLLESLERVCEEEYGKLETCHEKMVRKVRNKLERLEQKRKSSTSRKEKFELTNKINEAKGEINF